MIWHCFPVTRGSRILGIPKIDENFNPTFSALTEVYCEIENRYTVLKSMGYMSEQSGWEGLKIWLASNDSRDVRAAASIAVLFCNMLDTMCIYFKNPDTEEAYTSVSEILGHALDVPSRGDRMKAELVNDFKTVLDAFTTTIDITHDELISRNLITLTYNHSARAVVGDRKDTIPEAYSDAFDKLVAHSWDDYPGFGGVGYGGRCDVGWWGPQWTAGMSEGKSSIGIAWNGTPPAGGSFNVTVTWESGITGDYLASCPVTALIYFGGAVVGSFEYTCQNPAQTGKVSLSSGPGTYSVQTGGTEPDWPDWDGINARAGWYVEISGHWTF